MSVVESIESPSSKRFKQWRRQAEGQVRKTGRSLAAGARITAELALLPALDAAWLVPAGWEPASLPGPTRPVFALAPALFRELDTFGTGKPLLDLSVDGLVQPLPRTWEEGLYLVLPVQDPVNLGAAVRTAVGLGVKAVFLLPSAAHPGHPKAIRTSAGAIFLARFHLLEELADLTGPEAPVPVGLDRHGTPIERYAFPARTALVAGLEGPGLTGLSNSSGPHTESRDTMETIALPVARIESYNVGVAVAMAMYEWVRRRP